MDFNRAKSINIPKRRGIRGSSYFNIDSERDLFKATKSENIVAK